MLPKIRCWDVLGCTSVGIPSTYHQCVQYPLYRGHGTIPSDNDPLLEDEAYHADVHFYRIKDNKEKGKEKDEAGSFSTHQKFPLQGSPEWWPN